MSKMSGVAFHEVGAGGERAEPASSFVVNARLEALIFRRQMFSWGLAALMMLGYFLFVLSIAYFPSLLGRLITGLAPATWGIPIGLGLLLLPFLIVALYVYRANNVYDREMADMEIGDTA
ncbi:uncharacterized membrane protein (DUF485 family) [Paraburkholderia sp. GAS199]|uniref:DUF485 domain-containing protein n=1 Tax=Paraburkholderia sp. GAS199 TaxID=3035126 RepID=UPI003D20A9C3